MQDINTLKISIKHYSFSGSIHGKGGMKPKLMGPNFCYTIENIPFWGCRKQEMVQSERRMTSFILNLRSGVLLIHGQERVQIFTKQLTLIWDSISSSKVRYHLNINRFSMHIIDEYNNDKNFKLKLCTCAQSMALGSRTKFQLEILTRRTILVLYKFRENILESSRNVSKTSPLTLQNKWLLTHYGRVVPYGHINVSQHWVR